MKKILLGLVIILFIFSIVYYKYLNNNFINYPEVKITKIDLADSYKIKGCINRIILSKNSLSFKIANKNHRKYDFYINANYFKKNNSPIGEVKINGITINKKNKKGGFFTSNGKSPTFYFNKRPNSVLYSVQTHTPLIINGFPNDKIFNTNWGKSKLPRLVIGENKKGDIIVLHTIDNTKCSIEEFYKISKKQGLSNALMFDGGASIEVGISYKNLKYQYQIVSDLQRKLFKVPTPSVFIVGDFN